MKKENFTKILTELKYSPNVWQKWDKITRINLTTNGSLYMELGREKAEYKFDSANNLLLKRLVTKDNKVIKNSVIVNIDEIVSIEILTPYSESIFNGNSLLR